MTEKCCSICNKRKGLHMFYSQKRIINTGEIVFYYHPECKECTKKRSYQWNLDNPERRKEIQTNYEHTEKKRSRTRKRNKEYSKSGYFLEWQRNNKDRISAFNNNRRAFRKSLPDTLLEADIEFLYTISNGRCILTNDDNVELDHFIPLSWGHGGTYLGNVFLLSANLNRTKKNRNPFEWIKDERTYSVIDHRKWGDLVAFLAEMNGLTINEFEEFVNWCESNKRNIKEVEKDRGLTSLDIWQKSKNN